jgi:leucyl aminopeptidase
VLYPQGSIPAQRVILVGLGAQDALTADTLRRAAAAGLKKARDLKARSVVTALETGPLQASQAAEALVEGALLGLYSYHGQKSSDAPDDLPETLTIIATDTAAAEQGVQAGEAIAAGVRLTRNLVNLPPNICDPAYMAQAAREAGEAVGLKVEILERKQMEALGMGALLGVAQGSEAPPRFIIMEHNADKAAELDTLVLIGKGVTFDTGGYSIKTGEGMVGMKADMGGGGAVIGAMRAIGALKIPLHVVGLVPAADNMISGKSYRPQEVLKASNGVTIEVISTDAEGRLLLADALVFASRYKPAAVVDIATLTGACVIALGTCAAGLFSNSDQLRDALMAASGRTTEKIWPLPLFPEYDKAIESQTADIKNTGGRMGGVGTSAAFLQHFVDYPRWAHVDIAGVAGIDSLSGSNDNPYVPAKGATGFGARLLTDFVRNWQGNEVLDR